MRISDGAKKLGFQILRSNDGDPWSVRDVFTTENGSWEVGETGSIYEPPAWARFDYLWPIFDNAGADHHLLIHAVDKNGNPLEKTFEVSNGNFSQLLHTGDKQSLWIDFPLYDSVKPGILSDWLHNPTDSQTKFRGGGLPWNRHVSLFVVWEFDPTRDPEPNPDPDPEPEPGWGLRYVTLTGNTVIRISNPDHHKMIIRYNADE